MTALEEWFPLANGGHANAQFNLGVMYRNGKGVLQDDFKAAKWFRLAAEQGVVDAQFNLGFAYNRGEGVPKGYVQAHLWWSLAAANGDEEARERRDILAKRMIPADISEAQRLAREWLEEHGQ